MEILLKIQKWPDSASLVLLFITFKLEKIDDHLVEPQLPALFVDDSNSPINRALPLPASEGKPISVECRSVAGNIYAQLLYNRLPMYAQFRCFIS